MNALSRLKPTSFHLQWHITERCNFRCRHCYTEKKIEEVPANELRIIIDQYIDMIRIWELDRKNRPRKLTIGGGEPFLRSDFFGLLKVIQEKRNMFSSIGILSNGSMITKNIARKLKNYEISGIQISLEGTEKINDEIRGRGSFKKAVSGIKNALDVGLPVGVSVTIHKENYRDFPNLLGLLESLDIKSVGVSRLVPTGRGKCLRMLEPLEMRQFYGKIMALKKGGGKNDLHIHTHCSDSLWFIEDPNHETHGCSAGYDSFSILPNGDAVPCRRMPIKVGNVLEKSLIDIWYTSDFLWKLRNKGCIHSCKNCAIFSKCFGGARCVAYGHFNSIFAPDPQCWKLYNTLPRKREFPSKVADLAVLNEAYVEDFNPKKYFDGMSGI